MPSFSPYRSYAETSRFHSIVAGSSLEEQKATISAVARNLSVDIAIVGGGITGAAVAWTFARAGVLLPCSKWLASAAAAPPQAPRCSCRSPIRILPRWRAATVGRTRVESGAEAEALRASLSGRSKPWTFAVNSITWTRL